MEPSAATKHVDLGDEGEVSAPVCRQSLKSVLNAVFFKKNQNKTE